MPSIQDMKNQHAPATTGGSVKTLNQYFTQHRQQLAAALPKHLNPDRMARLAMTAFSQNRALSECDPKTIFASVIVASQLGLEIGIAGQGYLVPYKRTCTFIPGWMGYVDLVSRTGRAQTWTGAVYEGDEFDYEMGDKPYIRHRPGGNSDPNQLTHVYAVGRINGSDWPVIDVWPIAKILRHRDENNKVGKSHYSYKHLEMYARKIPLLQVIKYLPKSVEMQQAQEIDVAASQGRGAEYINGEFMIMDNEPTQDSNNDDSQQDNAGEQGQLTTGNHQGRETDTDDRGAANPEADKDHQPAAKGSKSKPRFNQSIE